MIPRSDLFPNENVYEELKSGLEKVPLLRSRHTGIVDALLYHRFGLGMLQTPDR